MNIDEMKEFVLLCFLMSKRDDKKSVVEILNALDELERYREHQGYDVDRVVEELERRLKEPQYQHTEEDYYVGIIDAIDIVKEVE